MRPDTKPLFKTDVESSHEGNTTTYTVTASLTAHGKAQLSRVLNRIAPQSTVIQTREGTILLIPTATK
jgi:hypothetical protein